MKLKRWKPIFLQTLQMTIYAVCTLILVTCPTTYAAISKAQQHAFEIGADYFDADLSCETTSYSAGNAPGSTDSKVLLPYIYTWLRGKGLTPIQAAATVGNISVESGGIPTRIQGTGVQTSNDPNAAGELGWGLIQWTPGRKIIGLAQGAGITTPIYDMETQLNLIYWHMTNLSPTADQNMLAGFTQTDISEATTYYERTMEGSGGKALDKRIAAANIALQEYESGTTTAYASISSSSAASTAQTTPADTSSDTSVTDASALAASSLQQSGCAPTVLSADTTDAGLKKLIQLYAWPTPDHLPTSEQTDAYKAAIAAAKAAGKYIGGADGDDCGGFITRLMQDSGRDPNYGGGGDTKVQAAYLQEHTELYKQVSFSEVKFGDIGIFERHTFMYIGTEIDGFKYPVVEAALRIGEESSAPRNNNSLEYNNNHGAIYFHYIGGSNVTL